MKKRIVVFGGSFNPPALHHLQMAQTLGQNFDEVVIVPCGLRPDKETVGCVETSHREAMVKSVFGSLPKIRVDFFDINNPVFTRTVGLQKKFNAEGELWHVVGADLCQHGGIGQSQIQLYWQNGSEIWRELNFAVFYRTGYEISEKDLPPHCRLFKVESSGSSTLVRDLIREEKDFSSLVTKEAKEYIDLHGLYK